TSLSYTSTTNSVTIKWGKAKNASGYRIYQKSGDKWKTVQTVNAKTTSITVKKLKASTTYSFRVKAYTKNGVLTTWGANSDTIKCKTKAVTKAAISSTSSTKNSVTLKWGKISGASGYRVYQKKGDKWVKLADVTSCSYTVKSLKASTSYSFKVRAYKTANKKTTWYDASNAVTVKTAADTAKIVSAYNTAINNAKKLKKGTVTYTSTIDMKCTDCSAKSIINVLNTVLKNMSGESETVKYNLAQDSAAEIIPPYGKNAKLSTANVASATEKKTDSGKVLTIKLKSETATFDGKKSVKAVGNESVTNTLDFADLDLGIKVKSSKAVYSGTQLTATLDSKGRLTKLVIKMPLTFSMTASISEVTLSSTIKGNSTDLYTIKY
ncbi:MAG: fibronectin type III domain-containing protein, partial [Ruminococcus sp.]|nr:fibronectin type III domain-containing protein [Ruminococcus sp.]